jgi:hypothetical protein
MSERSAKLFWEVVETEIEMKIDKFVKKLLTLNGFASMLAFKGHFLRNVPGEELISAIENSIQDLPDNAPVLSSLKLDNRRQDDFKLSEGEIGVILGLFEEMKEVVNKGLSTVAHTPSSNLNTSTSSLNSSTSSNHSLTRRSVSITPANAASEVQRVIRKRLGDRMLDETPDPTIFRTKTSEFPYSLEVQCLHCPRIIKVTISRDKTTGYFNLQTLKYTQHVKSCGHTED